MKAVFLDRDGTINIDPGYISDPDNLRLLPGAAEGLARMRGMGFLLFVLSNQSGVGRGFFSALDLDRVNGRLMSLLRAQSGVELDGIYCCLHRPEENCPCRKPRPGLVHAVVSRYPDIDLSASYFIGDKDIDIQAGKAVCCRTIRIVSGHTTPPGTDKFSTPDHVAADLLEAAARMADDGN